MKKIISLVIVCMIIISGIFIYNKSDKKEVLEDGSGPIIAAVIDGKASTSFPTTNKYVKFFNKCWRILRVGGDGISEKPYVVN